MKYELNVKVVVIKNNALGQIKWEQMVFLGNPEYGCELQPIDFVAVAEAAACAACTIEDPARCGEQLREALATPGPVPHRGGGRPVRAADAAQDQAEAGAALRRSRSPAASRTAARSP